MYDGAAGHGVKILGDMNAKIGREKMYKPVIGQESIHMDSNNNGESLIDFAVSRTFNQVDHVLIDHRHGSDVKDIRSCRGADCDSDHFMVRVKYKQRIANIRKAKGVRQKK